MARPNSIFGTGFGIFLGLIFIVALVAQIMLAIRRFHDLNFSGWWCLAYFFALWIGNTLDRIINDNTENLFLLIFCLVLNLIVFISSLVLIFKRGTAGANKYGADPLENS